jgi:hypothetical protein
MKTILITLLILLSGCSHKYIQIEKGDAVYIVDIGEVLKDQKANTITVTVNPLTGEHTLVIDRLSSETSPFVQAMGQALLEAYKAGRAGL